MFNNADRLKVNMGNIYLKLGQFSRALKMYNMALDHVPTTHKDLRLVVLRFSMRIWIIFQ
jgi:intraflagellar transport protein 88